MTSGEGDKMTGAMNPCPGEERLVEALRRAYRVTAFCGAGVSAESGMPTFRDAGGLWEGHRAVDIATRQAFAADPLRVWRFYAARLDRLETVAPNPAHRVLAAMERHYPEFLLVSQNVDDLHERAGSRRLVKLHGSLLQTACTRCGRLGDAREQRISALVAEGRLPFCPCGGLLRPNVVWFGERIDEAHLADLDRALRPAPAGDLLLLILGTSGEVSGGYGLAEAARAAGGFVVEVNPAPSALTDLVDLSLRAPAGELLDRIWKRL